MVRLDSSVNKQANKNLLSLAGKRAESEVVP